MATLVSDWTITELEQVEEEGVTRSLVRRFLAEGLNNTNTDNRTLDEALAVSGVPVSGDKAPGNTNLVCHRRTVRPVTGSPTKAEITCEYKTVADWANSFIFSGGTSVNQTTTDVDFYGNRISLSYTYPGDYPVKELQDETYTTSINESVFTPETTLTATGSLYVNYPNEISQTWAGSVNSTFWAGAPGVVLAVYALRLHRARCRPRALAPVGVYLDISIPAAILGSSCQDYRPEHGPRTRRCSSEYWRQNSGLVSDAGFQPSIREHVMAELDVNQRTTVPHNEPITHVFLAKIKHLILNAVVGGRGIRVVRSGENVIIETDPTPRGLGSTGGSITMYTATTKAGLPSGVAETSLGRVTAGSDQGELYKRNAANTGWESFTKWE